jgi:hypothetical protein
MLKRMTQVARLVCVVGMIGGFASAAAANDWKRGRAPVSSVDSAARTILLDDEVYQVPISCRIQRESGVRIALSDLRVSIRPGVLVVPTNDIDYVHYEAIQKRGGWEMVEITVLERAPQ